MPLTFEDRKRRMPIGAQQRVAVAQGVPESFVSAAMRDELHPKREPTREKLRRVQEALAAEIDPALPVEEVFPQTKQEAALESAQTS
jgi:hypothetical protein